MSYFGKGQFAVILFTLVVCAGLAFFGYMVRSDEGHASTNSIAPGSSSASDGSPSAPKGTGLSPPDDGSASPSDGPSSSPGATDSVPTDDEADDTDPPSGPVITAPDGTPLDTPEGIVPAAPADTTSSTSAASTTEPSSVMLPSPYEQAETFVREYWTIAEGETEEEWRARVGQYGTERVRTRLLPFTIADGVSSEVQITPLTEINGAMGNTWAEFNIVANVTKVVNGESVETIPYPTYVSVRLEDGGWIVSGFSFFTV